MYMRFEKSQYIAIISGVFVIILFSLGFVYFSGKNTQQDAVNGYVTRKPENVSNVFMQGDIQVIEVTAKGGYSPRVTNAKSGVSSVIKFITHGTFDCSSSVVIPSIGYNKNLPSSGESTINIPSQSAGSVLKGTCGMGMYHFEVRFN